MKSIFISYARKDEFYKNELVKHLHALVLNKKIKIWEDGLIEAGTDWHEIIKKKLKSSDLVLLLVSSDSIVSTYINKVEIKKAMKGHKKGKKLVVPIIIRPCTWQKLPIAKIQGLPKYGKPISKWDDIDEAFVDVVNGIEKII